MMVISDVVLMLASGVAVVLGAAAFGKAVSPASTWEKVAALPEISLGILLAGLRWPSIVAVAFLLSAGYTVWAVTRSKDSRCTCFGAGLPSTSRTGQVVRNLSMTAVAAFCLALSLAYGAREPSLPVLDLSLGLVIGAAMVVTPWLGSWLSEGTPSSRRSAGLNSAES